MTGLSPKITVRDGRSDGFGFDEPLPDSVEGILQFVEPSAEKPRWYAGTAPAGVPPIGGDYRTCPVPIRNGRGFADTFRLDVECFAVVRSPSTVTDLLDEAQTLALGHPETAQLVRQVTGASRVVVFDHTVRQRTDGELDRAPGQARPPASREPAGTVLTYDEQGTARGNALKTTKPIAAFDADTTTALAFLRDHPACTGRLGTMGVCLGGHLALRAAFDPAVSAAACFYATDVHSGTLGAGDGDDSLARLSDLKAQTLFVWGRQDPHVPFAGREVIRARLEEVSAVYEWHEVNAAHAFLRDEGPRYDPALFLQSMAWTLALFQRRLS